MKVDAQKEASYADLVIAVCEGNRPQGGFSIEDISKRLRLKAVAEKGGKNLEFEDADVSELKALVKGMRWFSVHEDIVKFSEDVNSL